MDGRIRGRRETWVRVGSEVEGGQVEFEQVCAGGVGWCVGQLKRHRCVCVRVMDRRAV